VTQDDLRLYAKNEQVNKAFQQLSDNQQKLAEACQTNFSAIRGGFELVDGHQFIFRRVLNDMVKGCVQTNETGVDFEWYFRELTVTRAVAMAIATLKDEIKQDPMSELRKLAGDDMVFGGDYVESQGQPPQSP
jgi:hypothetical protein